MKFCITRLILFGAGFIFTIYDPLFYGLKFLRRIHPFERFQESNQINQTIENKLFIFLKFIQSVIPTIEYDYTVAVNGFG